MGGGDEVSECLLYVRLKSQPRHSFVFQGQSIGNGGTAFAENDGRCSEVQWFFRSAATTQLHAQTHTTPFAAFCCRTTKKGYEEVHVPALKPKPYAEGEKLVAISELPEWAQPAFANMQSLNRVQSRVADCALYSSENMLVCAPTGEWLESTVHRLHMDTWTVKAPCA